MIVSKIMFGLTTIRINKKDVEELDRVQRRVFRVILGLYRRVPKQFLQREGDIILSQI